MACCGGSKSRAAQGVLLHDVQYVEAVYVGEGDTGERSLYSNTKMDPTTRRRLLISPAASPGDILQVPMSDILNNPTLYQSTCGKPFIKNGNTVIDPCSGYIEEPSIGPIEDVIENFGVPEIVTKWDDTEESLIGEFGVMAARGIIDKFGHLSVGEVYELDDDEIEKKINLRTAGIIARRRDKK